MQSIKSSAKKSRGVAAGLTQIILSLLFSMLIASIIAISYPHEEFLFVLVIGGLFLFLFYKSAFDGLNTVDDLRVRRLIGIVTLTYGIISTTACILTISFFPAQLSGWLVYGTFPNILVFLFGLIALLSRNKKMENTETENSGTDDNN